MSFRKFSSEIFCFWVLQNWTVFQHKTKCQINSQCFWYGHTQWCCHINVHGLDSHTYVHVQTTQRGRQAGICKYVKARFAFHTKYRENILYIHTYMPLDIHNFLKVFLNPNKFISTSRKMQRGSSCHLPSEEVERQFPFFCI